MTRRPISRSPAGARHAGSPCRSPRCAGAGGADGRLTCSAASAHLPRATSSERRGPVSSAHAAGRPPLVSPVRSHAMSSRPSRLPSPASGVMFQELDDGAVLFSPASEVYFGLNHVGAAVWALLPPVSDTLDALCAALGERYPDAPPATIAADVARLLAELGEAGLVRPPEDA